MATENQVMARTFHINDSIGTKIAVLNSEGMKLPDNTELYAAPQPVTDTDPLVVALEVLANADGSDTNVSSADVLAARVRGHAKRALEAARKPVTMMGRDPEEFGRELALIVIGKFKIPRLVVSATLDLAKPETIHNFNTFGKMLLHAHGIGQEFERRMRGDPNRELLKLRDAVDLFLRSEVNPKAGSYSEIIAPLIDALQPVRHLK